MQHALVERLFEALIAGDRPMARLIAAQARQALGSAQQVITDIFWPTHQTIEKLFKADQLTRMNHHMAVRLLRQLIDQNAAHLTFSYDQERSIMVFCGPSENEELGAQMAVDIMESSGYTVFFGGAGIASDEIIARVNDEKPGVLMMFCSAAADLPDIRAMIDKMREIGAASQTQIAVGGGVFNRAEGLAEEIGADLWAVSPMEMAELLALEPERRAETNQRTVGRGKRRKAA